MSKDRIKRILKLGQEGHIPSPFSQNLGTDSFVVPAESQCISMELEAEKEDKQESLKRKRSISSSSSSSLSSSSSSASSSSSSTSSASKQASTSKFEDCGLLMRDEIPDTIIKTSANMVEVDTSSETNKNNNNAVSMPFSSDVNTGNTNCQFVNQNAIAEDDVTRDDLISPSLIEENKLHKSLLDESTASPFMDLSLHFSNNEQPAGFDFSPDDSGDEYLPPQPGRYTRLSDSSTTSSRSPSTASRNLENVPPKGKKRLKNPKQWKKTITKDLKNSGKEYISSRGKKVDAKIMKQPCNCRLNCRSKFSEDQRREIFQGFWDLSSFQRQREFLSSRIEILNISCRRIKNLTKPRKPNCSFSLLKDGQNSQVCKTFLLNTLGITERTLRTVIEAKTSNTGIAPIDNRGKHTNHKKTDPEIMQSIRDHINSIPRIESHYLRANTSRQFIDGGLTIAEMHRHYKAHRTALGKDAASYDIYAKIFNTEFNISFFVPKKDQCDICESFKNAVGEDKEKLLIEYTSHQREKELSRSHKSEDKKICNESNSNVLVAIYDLQAVMPVPIGESSAFFYRSKLNCFNFTVTDIKNKSTDCFFWHEGLGNRGAVEIGTCVFKFLEKVALESPNTHIVFYSDNCCGQQKNRFIFSMYAYAVKYLPIQSITHKFLVRGHTQNEGDNAHSIIEKSIKSAKKTGPIYVPEQYVQIIRNAKKKGKPYTVNELTFTDFYDWKLLTEELGVNFSKNIDGDKIKLTDIRLIRFIKDSDVYSYKTSYEDAAEWIQCRINIVNKRSTRRNQTDEIVLKPAYKSKITISGRKKDDLLHLINSNIVPKYYEVFYNSLF